jgi:hypothetical protein
MRPCPTTVIRMRTLCILVPGEARADVYVDGERIAEANRSKQHFCKSKRIPLKFISFDSENEGKE